MTYNPNLELVFGIFMIMVPFIVMGALGIATVIYAKKEGEPSPVAKSQIPPASGEVHELPPLPTDILELASQLEDLLRKRVKGEPDLQVSNGSHDLKLAQELNTWAEWERGLQKPQQEQEPS